MKNGWLPLKMARVMNMTGYVGEQHARHVLFWVRGFGVVTGRIYDTPEGLLASLDYIPAAAQQGNIDGWQMMPLSPRTRRK